MNRSMIGFYCYRIFSRLYFHVPMLFVYFYVAGLSIIQIELLLAVYGVVLMTAPKLLSQFKNVHRQKNVIIIGEAIKALGLLCFMLSQNTVVLIVGQILCGLGYSFTAGTESVLLRKLFQHYDGSQYNYKQVESRSNSYMYISFLAGGILGSIIYQINPQLIFVLSILSNILALLSASTIMETEQERTGEKQAQSNGKTPQQEVSKQLPDPSVSFWKNYYAASRAATLAIFVGFLPYYFFIVADVNLYYFSAILSLFNLFGFLSSRAIVGLSKRFGHQTLAVCTSVVLVTGFVILAVSHNIVISVLIISFLGLASGGVRPITLANINKSDMSQETRTKVLSSMEQQYGFWNAFLLISGGFVLVKFGFTPLMLTVVSLYTLLIIGNTIRYKTNKQQEAL